MSQASAAGLQSPSPASQPAPARTRRSAHPHRSAIRSSSAPIARASAPGLSSPETTSSAGARRSGGAGGEPDRLGRGKRTWKVAPCPGPLSTSSAPACSITSCRARGSPRTAPEGSGSPANGSKSRSCCWRLSPGPPSLTLRCRKGRSTAAARRRRPRRVRRAALSSSSRRTWARRDRSARRRGRRGGRSSSQSTPGPARPAAAAARKPSSSTGRGSMTLMDRWSRSIAARDMSSRSPVTRSWRSAWAWMW